MDWRSWRLSDWNAALIKAIFFDRERLAMKITRISASDRFLVHCTGDQEAERREVARHFVSCFGNRVSQFTEHYSWSPQVERETAEKGCPQVFAALYLTLLAATADEATFDEGNFRTRFVELVSHSNLTNAPSFTYLSRLWEHVQAWSVSRARKFGDCRVLLLPNKQHEKLIGYSKRLAFPTFRDEKALERVLQQSRLGQESNYTDITRVVSRHEDWFTEAFREEYRFFFALVSALRYQEAYDSPFWGAVQSITWETDKETLDQVGYYRLGVDISDPCYPELYLLTDKTGSKTLGSGHSVRSLGARNLNMYLVQPTGASSWTPTALLHLAASNTKLLRTTLWKRLSNGCIALFRDTFGNLTHDGEYFDGAPACLLIQGEFGAEIVSTATALRLKFIEASIDACADWKIVLFEELRSEALERLAFGLPEAAKASLPFGWRPPSVHCSGGAWYGQALLLSPASSPVFSLAGAVSGSFQAWDGAGELILQGDLNEANQLDSEAGFQIPPSALLAMSAADTLRVHLNTLGEYSASAKYSVVERVPIGGPVPLSDARAWLADGRDGMLRALDTAPQEYVGRKVAMRTTMNMPYFRKSAEVNLSGVDSVGLSDIVQPLGWLQDALMLRYQRRPTLSLSDLYGHVNPASVAANVKPWLIRKLLLSSGWLMYIQRRTSPFSIIAPVRRTIALRESNGTATARIAGMLTAFECSKLAAALVPGEAVLRLGSKAGLLGIGAIELQLSSFSRVAELAKEFEFDVVTKESFGLPLLPLCQLDIDQAAPLPRPPSHANSETWQPSKNKWIPNTGPADALKIGSILRVRGAQRYGYWVTTSNGQLYTDSQAWAWILGLAATGSEVGNIAADESCLFSPRVETLPVSLVHWWLLWGGGFIGIKPCGSICLAGTGGSSLWQKLRGWIDEPQSANRHALDVAIDRRKLALKLKASGRSVHYR